MLARDTGIAPATISRIVTAAQVPDFETQLVLARTLGFSVREFLIRTGKAAPEDFPETGAQTGHAPVVSGKPLTPRELAEAAGVPDGDLDWFEIMVRRLRSGGDAGGDSTAGGAAAEG